jgi:hypothetical protein
MFQHLIDLEQAASPERQLARQCHATSLRSSHRAGASSG